MDFMTKVYTVSLPVKVFLSSCDSRMAAVSCEGQRPLLKALSLIMMAVSELKYGLIILGLQDLCQHF
jgi:hypothetical protein